MKVKSERARHVKWLARLAGAGCANLGDALYQVGMIAAAWPRLRADERRQIRAAASNLAGLVEQRTSRATGLVYSIFDSMAQGIETQPSKEDFVRGRNQLKYTVICDTHAACVCVSSVAHARTACASPDFCDDCREILDEKGWFGR